MGEVLSFIFPFDGTSSSEDSLPLLKLLDDDESSGFGFIVMQIVSIWGKVQMNPPS